MALTGPPGFSLIYASGSWLGCGRAATSIRCWLLTKGFGRYVVVAHIVLNFARINKSWRLINVQESVLKAVIVYALATTCWDVDCICVC